MFPWHISEIGTCQGSMASETLRIALKLFLSHHELVSNEFNESLQRSAKNHHDHDHIMVILSWLIYIYIYILLISWYIMVISVVSWCLSLHQWDASRKMKKNVSEQTQESFFCEHICWSQASLNILPSGLQCSQGLPLVNKNTVRLLEWRMRCMLHPRFEAMVVCPSSTPQRLKGWQGDLWEAQGPTRHERNLWNKVVCMSLGTGSIHSIEKPWKAVDNT